MYQIIKFCGLNAEQVGALDKVLASDVVLSTERCVKIFPTHESEGRVPFAERLNVRSDQNQAFSYVYEVKLHTQQLVMMRSCGVINTYTLTSPKRVLDALFSAVADWSTAESYSLVD